MAKSNQGKSKRRKPEVTFCACGEHAFTNLTQGYVALVSPEDSDLIAAYLWYALRPKVGGVPTGKVYAARTRYGDGRQHYLLLHREITGTVGTADVDHANGNGLDNQRPNLRPCSHAENGANRKINRNSKTGYKGVVRRRKRYSAAITVAGRAIHLGTFDCPREAAKAYNAAAEVHFGEYANLNPID